MGEIRPGGDRPKAGGALIWICKRRLDIANLVENGIYDGVGSSNGECDVSSGISLRVLWCGPTPSEMRMAEAMNRRA